jgi:hypothetical protein
MVDQRDDTAVQFLDLLLDYFADKRRWTRGAFYDRGKRCLVGAISYLGRRHRMETREAAEFLEDALPRPGFGLMTFNDNCEGIAELRALIVRARERALVDAAQRRTWRERTPALIAAEAEQEKRRQGMAALYRELILARLDRERAARAAAGDIRETYILCPDAPERERLAA